MKLQQLKFVTEIFRTGSVSLTAKRMHISQPWISQELSKLEEILGTKIFVRSRTGMEPTKEGLKIIKKSQEILNEIEELKQISDVQSSHIKGFLSIATISSLTTSVLSKTLKDFQESFPNVKIDLIEGSSSEIQKKVKNNEADIGLFAIPIEYERDNINPFLKSKMVICVGRESGLADYKSISLKEAVQHPIISASDVLIDNLKEYGEPNVLFKFDFPETGKRMISDNLAIGFFPELSLKHDPYVRMGEIIPISIEETNLDLIYCWITPKGGKMVLRDHFIKSLLFQSTIVKGNFSPN